MPYDKLLSRGFCLMIMPLTPNQQLFEYRIVRVLGRGAFGTVCLAHDAFLDRPVAIKELTLTAQTDEVTFKRFLQEARAALMLDGNRQQSLLGWLEQAQASTPICWTTLT